MWPRDRRRFPASEIASKNALQSSDPKQSLAGAMTSWMHYYIHPPCNSDSHWPSLYFIATLLFNGSISGAECYLSLLARPLRCRLGQQNLARLEHSARLLDIQTQMTIATLMLPLHPSACECQMSQVRQNGNDCYRAQSLKKAVHGTDFGDTKGWSASNLPHPGQVAGEFPLYIGRHLYQ